MNEAAVQNHTRLAFSAIGPNWRNNVGSLLDARGVPIRYGLANENKSQNETTKSSDVIAITPVTAFIQSYGWCTLGVFTALEIKHSDWIRNERDKHENAQAHFHDIVRAAGGFAGFVRHPDDIHGIIRRS